MKIYIDICNKFPEVDLLSAAFTCRGKHGDFSCFSKKDWLKWLVAEQLPLRLFSFVCVLRRWINLLLRNLCDIRTSIRGILCRVHGQI